ncbi:hypothetical protein RHO12_06805 [Orbus sturtevantii]|uniref:hypothetical protein n=1 Tax=Orbus sturtevantii TaxID=3074109 RepID=UPI00370D4BE4
MAKTTDINQTRFLAMSCLLQQGKNIDMTSTFIAIITIFCCCCSLFLQLPLVAIIGLLGMISVLLWLIQKYYAMRIAIDMELFSYFALHYQSADERANELDDFLNNLGLKKRSNQNWLQRQQGTLNLLKKQVIFFIGQVMLFFMIFASQFLNL